MKLAPYTGAEGFDAFYRALWGERWNVLSKALLEPPRRSAYSYNLQKPYLLDNASVFTAAAFASAVFAVPPKGASPDGRHILDACAAPGGKALVVSSLMPPNFSLTANELSSERRRRLVKVLDEHLPPAIREQVKVSGFDAAAIAAKKTEHERFDAVLLDAPCSSERHVLASPVHLARWTAARPASLAHRQWALLSATFLLLKPGGTLVYATCSVNPAENDDIIRRLQKKYSGAVRMETPDFAEIARHLPPILTAEDSRLKPESTGTGIIILPDVSGAGPMFTAVVRKEAPLLYDR
ncbi:MAG: 16S rRNA methyltransferase [Spirochaetaceae bacterium]|jgi:16S rRNA (cytosine1407-C5)-methyltransferase|nr:16S rRNA methyltransferase [Spirochaetaceae bacterium]